MLAISWRRWMTPIADSGRELDLPRRLLEGEMLYRDLHYLYPPLTPYLHALLYRWCGETLLVPQLAGGLASLLIVGLAWRMSRSLMGRREAAMAAAVVLLLCVFKPTGTMISPYAYAALYGCLLSMAILWLAIEEKGERWRRYLIGGLLGATLLTKLEFAMAGAFVVVVHALLRAWLTSGGSWRVAGREALRLLLPVGLLSLAIAGPVYGYFFYHVGWETLLTDCHLFYTHLPSSLLLYNARRSGLDRPLLSLLQLVGGGLVLGVALLLLAVSTDPRRAWRARSRVAVALLLLGLGVGAIYLASRGQWDGSPLRFLPVVLLGGGVAGWRWMARGDRRGPISILLAVYGLAVLARVALRVPSGGAFGGFFLPIPLVLFSYGWLVGWPEWLGAKIEGGAQVVQRAGRVAAWAILLLLLGMAVVHGHRYRRLYAFPIETARGDFYAPTSTGPALAEALSFLERETAPGDRILVLPEGSELAFLTGRRMPLRHQIFLPGLMSSSEERTMLQSLERSPVEYLFLVNRPMREFGAVAFGDDFYRPFGNWIETHYRRVATLGEGVSPTARIGDPTFFIHVYRWSGRFPSPQ
jgi:4-amino-4-deoxy-L-arabinose transferase-like glycosyltransferase